MLNFQDMVARLIKYWTDQGCLVHQGYDLEVGAGTFNPATFLRALGPEPYSAVYVEPSRRPQDGRYGENPNRLQHYHQMQVIIKPSPPNILELYVKSLEAIGLNLKEHDIRFVHDDWENPTIGAAGLGWEVWLDGMEITQFTYFQVIGGMVAKPVSGEITYGLERIAMYLQEVDSFFDIKWNDQISYGDIFKHSEWEWSHYNFNEATVDMWQHHFEDFEKEAKKLLASSFPIPAYDFIMKASHAFNILEARGVISVTERTGYITRIRNLAKELAEKYIQLREKLSFPLLKKDSEASLPKTIPEKKLSHSAEKASFLLEIGSEELPHTFVPIGMNQLERKIRSFLEEHELSHGDIKTYGTPRRLAILIENLASQSKPKKIEKKGPSLNLAFDEKGKITNIGVAFFRSLGIENLSLAQIKEGTSCVSLRTIKNSEYLFASLLEKEKSTKDLLSKNLASLILSLNFPKKMRWGHFDNEYARPIRWITSLYGQEIVPFSMNDVTAGNTSYGHRQIDPSPFIINSADEYVETLRAHHVLADVTTRKELIEQELKNIENKGFTIVAKLKVLPIVVHLVEWPFVLEGSFSPEYLRAPQEVLISEMVEHQKYFPLQNIKDGSLAPYFVIVANNFPTDKIRRGNEKALNPRLCDGLFLYEEDTKVPLEHFNKKLKNLSFQKDLGSMSAKVDRVKKNASILHQFLPICSLEKLMRTAELCKADLTTELVQEFPDLQGVIGENYALHSQEDKEIALAIREHWMPLGEEASLPQSSLGILLSIADKIDNFLSFFALGLVPTSSSDPYALRRQATGVIKMILENKLSLSLHDLLQKSFNEFIKNPEIQETTRSQFSAQKDKIFAEIEEFFKNRIKTIFTDLEFPKDEIEAVLSKGCDNIFATFCLLEALHLFRRKEHAAFCKILTVYTRTKKILYNQKNAIPTPDPLLFTEEAEKKLFIKLNEIQEMSPCDEKALYLLSQIEPFIAHLFETVTIMHEDEKLKNNRLSLLNKVLSKCEELIDFGKIQEHNS